jgi:hypothetical protein
MVMAELLTDPKHVRADLRQIGIAVRKGWQIPESVFERAGVIIGQILATGSNREKVSAMRCLIAMNAANNPQPVTISHQHQHIHMEASREVTLEQRKQQLLERVNRLR